MTGDRKPRVFLNSRFEEGEARFSFDGRWLAYQSDESGRPEVYVRAFPGPGGKRQISVGGGSEPRWGRGGRGLYYRQGGAVMVVTVTAAGADFVASVPRRLFSVQVPDQSREPTTWQRLARCVWARRRPRNWDPFGNPSHRM